MAVICHQLRPPARDGALSAGNADLEGQARGLELARLLTDGALRASGSAGRAAVADSSAAGQPAADPAAWRSEALDALAAGLAEPAMLSSQPGAAPLLGRLLAGAGARPLLGEAAAEAALERLQSVLQASDDAPGVFRGDSSPSWNASTLV